MPYRSHRGPARSRDVYLFLERIGRVVSIVVMFKVLVDRAAMDPFIGELARDIARASRGNRSETRGYRAALRLLSPRCAQQDVVFQHQKHLMRASRALKEQRAILQTMQPDTLAKAGIPPSVDYDSTVEEDPDAGDELDEEEEEAQSEDTIANSVRQVNL